MMDVIPRLQPHCLLYPPQPLQQLIHRHRKHHPEPSRFCRVEIAPSIQPHPFIIERLIQLILFLETDSLLALLRRRGEQVREEVDTSLGRHIRDFVVVEEVLEQLVVCGEVLGVECKYFLEEGLVL